MSKPVGGELGHAYLIAGDAATLAPLSRWLHERGIDVEQNPDVYIRSYKQFGVEEAREIRDRAQTRGVREARIFIITAPNMTTEAQNALLKTLEESPGGARFFLIVPSPHTLLATVRSRSQILSLGREKAADEVDIQEFLAASSEERIDMLKPLYMHDEDDERDVRGAVAFLSALEQELGKHVENEGARKGLEAVYRARKYMMDKGSLLKALLEQVALLVPKV